MVPQLLGEQAVDPLVDRLVDRLPALTSETRVLSGQSLLMAWMQLDSQQEQRLMRNALGTHQATMAWICQAP